MWPDRKSNGETIIQRVRGKHMNIAANASVYCLDGYFGRSTYIILNPITKQVTHLVVQEDVVTFPERLVPIDLVANTTPDRIDLICTRSELRYMENFTRTEFLPSDLPDHQFDTHLMWPFLVSKIEMKAVEVESIPSGELAVRRNAKVEAPDGFVGHVDEYIVDAQGERITHLVVRTGHLWERRRVDVPVSKIDHIEKNVVYLKLDKHEIEQLPIIPAGR
jgi:sporulation protein YlmC with PRC-barrel domain